MELDILCEVSSSIRRGIHEWVSMPLLPCQRKKNAHSIVTQHLAGILVFELLTNLFGK